MRLPDHSHASLRAGAVAAFAVWLLWRNRHRLDATDFFERYGFLYDGYQLIHGRFLWEAIVLLRKLSLVFIVVTISDAFFQVFAGVVVISSFLALQIYVRPYDSRTLNSLEIAAMASLWVSLMASVLYWRFPEGQRPDAPISAVIILVNLGMLLVFATLIVCAAVLRPVSLSLWRLTS